MCGTWIRPLVHESAGRRMAHHARAGPPEPACAAQPVPELGGCSRTGSPHAHQSTSRVVMSHGGMAHTVSMGFDRDISHIRHPSDAASTSSALLCLLSKAFVGGFLSP